MFVIAGGLGASVLPRLALADPIPGTVTRPLHPPVARELGYVLRREKVVDRGLRGDRGAGDVAVRLTGCGPELKCRPGMVPGRQPTEASSMLYHARRLPLILIALTIKIKVIRVTR